MGISIETKSSQHDMGLENRKAKKWKPANAPNATTLLALMGTRVSYSKINDLPDKTQEVLCTMTKVTVTY